ncbi:UNVERIFIED_CONTAM: hypothetical protein Sradi_7054700 [Sesamum radiatum]|uniref:Integrase catalytic domain-containing protein n=1 Tax=Sesamum radiatum TaxID=300843 RepID=A0AAW2J7E1_SESRA
MRKVPKSLPLIHQPAEPLTTMLSPCPFTQWGMDIIGLFDVATDQRKFLLVAIDYFTEWVGAEPLACIIEGEVMKFSWKSIRFTTVAHPQSNGQIEVTNRILVQGIKRRLERVRGNWTEELTSVSWAYRMTPRGSTGENPFSLVYGTEAIIPAELGMSSHRILNFSEESNRDLLKENLDLI